MEPVSIAETYQYYIWKAFSDWIQYSGKWSEFFARRSKFRINNLKWHRADWTILFIMASLPYIQQLSKVIVAQISQTIGWNSIQSIPLELMGDILHKYMQELTRQIHRYSELCKLTGYYLKCYDWDDCFSAVIAGVEGIVQCIPSNSNNVMII